MKKLFHACSVNDIPSKAGKKILLNNHKIALFKNNGKIVAIYDRCPHQAAELSDGYISDGIIHCPMHGWTFEADTGAFTLNDNMKLRMFPVEIKDDDVYIELEE